MSDAGLTAPSGSGDSLRRSSTLHSRERQESGEMTDLGPVLEEVRRGMIPAHIYIDEAIFPLARERVFGRAWVFVGPTSETPLRGDYVVRRVLEDSSIVARGED